MSLLAIRLVPDPVLRAPCGPAASYEGDLAALARDMLDTMYAAPGRGLAAPQVGLSLRLFVMDPTWKEGRFAPLVLLDPEVIEASEEVETAEEGCLSIPDTPCRVTRPAWVRVRWRDLDGAMHEERLDGFAARCAQHEIDHLDGILCTDRGVPPGAAPMAAPA